MILEKKISFVFEIRLILIILLSYFTHNTYSFRHILSTLFIVSFSIFLYSLCTNPDKNLTTSRPSAQQLPAHTSSTTGSCHLSVICKQPYSSLKDYTTSIFTVKHQLRRRCLQQPTATELVVFEDVARSTAMVNPELRRQSVEIVDVRIICSIPFEIGGIFLN